MTNRQVARNLLAKVKKERRKRRFVLRQVGPKTWVEEEILEEIIIFDKNAKQKRIYKRLKIEDNAL